MFIIITIYVNRILILKIKYYLKINIFISEVTFRYGKMDSFLRKISKTANDYNKLLKQMFIRLNNIKDDILEFCLGRKNSIYIYYI